MSTSKYQEIFNKLITSPSQSLRIKVPNSTNLAALKSGLARRKKVADEEFKKVSGIWGEEDEYQLQNKTFEYQEKPASGGIVVEIALVSKVFDFEIVPEEEIKYDQL